MFKSNDLKNYKLFSAPTYKTYESEKKQTSNYLNTNTSSSSCKDIKECLRLQPEIYLNTNSTTIPGNKEKIILSMRNLKFQRSSLDHQRYSYEKLILSKSKNFCILVNYDKKKVLVSIINKYNYLQSIRNLKVYTK